jgi:tRNA-dihydrouridine synthase C
VLSQAGCAPAWFTPFIHISNGVPRTARLRLALRPFQETGLPVIAQIMSSRMELLPPTARKLHDIGALCVDVNCACPSKTVVHSRSGGALLQNPAWIAQAISLMKESCGNNPVSVKIRTGFRSPDEMQGIAAALREARPDIVFCHYRTVLEGYAPLPPETRTLRFSQLRRLLPDLPLFASGDIFTLQDIRKMAELGLDGALVARGFLRNPAILQALQAEGTPLSEEQLWHLLIQIGEASRRTPAHWGFLLPVARNMFGADAPATQRLVKIVSGQEPPPKILEYGRPLE